MRRPNGSWRVDETYVKVAGKWAYLYRAVDSAGETIRADLNARLRGWQNYFSYGAVARPYATVNRYVYDRVRYFLRRRHTTTHSRGTRQFSDDVVFGRLRVYSLRPH